MASPQSPLLLGRDAVLQEIIAAAQAHRSVRLDGPPGVGKRAMLAAMSARLPDALHIDLGGAKTLFDTAQELRDGFGLAPVVDVSVRATLTRAAFAANARGLRFLVLPGLNARAEAALDVLARGAPGLNVIFSGPPRIHADHRVAVAPLDAASATAFFAAARGEDGRDDEPGAFASWIDALGGHPLALAVVAHAAHRVHSLDLDALLAAAPTMQSSADRALALAWHVLAPDEQRALTALRIFHAPFTLESAEAVLGAGDGDAVDAILALKRAELITATSTAGGTFRFFLPPGVRHMIAQHVPLGDATFASNTHALCAHFGRRREAWSAYTKASRQRFHAERAHIAMVAQHPSAQPSERADAALTFASHAQWSGPVLEVAALCEEAAGHAEAAPWLHLARVNLALSAGQWADARAAFDAAKSADAPPLEWAIAAAHVASVSGDEAGAERAAERAMKLWPERAPRQTLRCALRLCLAVIDGLALNFDAVTTALHEGSDDARLVCTSWRATGAAARRHGALTDARYAFGRALEAAAQHPEERRNAQLHIARCDLEEGRPEAAEPVLRALLAEAEHAVAPGIYVESATGLAICNLMAGRIDAALTLAADAANAPVADGRAKRRRALARAVLAFAHARNGDVDAARDALAEGDADLDAGAADERALWQAWADAVARLVDAPVPGTDEGPPLFAGYIAALAAQHGAPQPARAELHIGPDARSMQLPVGDPVDLSRRGPLRLILLALAAAHRTHRGQPLGVDALIAAGWPGQRILAEAAPARVYAAIRTLRRLGLEEILLTDEDGYLLDPKMRVVVRS